MDDIKTRTDEERRAAAKEMGRRRGLRGDPLPEQYWRMSAGGLREDLHRGWWEGRVELGRSTKDPTT